MNTYKQKQDQLVPTTQRDTHRQRLAAHEQRLPPPGCQQHSALASGRQKTAEALGTSFARHDEKPPHLGGHRQKTDAIQTPHQLQAQESR
jgi:hypothetical protein